MGFFYIGGVGKTRRRKCCQNNRKRSEQEAMDTGSPPPQQQCPFLHVHQEFLPVHVEAMDRQSPFLPVQDDGSTFRLSPFLQVHNVRALRSCCNAANAQAASALILLCLYTCSVCVAMQCCFPLKMSLCITAQPPCNIYHFYKCLVFCVQQDDCTQLHITPLVTPMTSPCKLRQFTQSSNGNDLHHLVALGPMEASSSQLRIAITEEVGGETLMSASDIISVRPSKQPLMVRTVLKVYMELGSYFLFLQEQI